MGRRIDIALNIALIAFGSVASVEAIGYVGPIVEESVWPHSGMRHVTQQRRTEKTFAWTWRVDKKRPGPTVIWDFRLSDDKGNVEPFVPYRCIEGENPPGVTLGELPKESEALPVGDNQMVSLCVPLSTWVHEDTPITITGRMGFQGWGPWTTWESIKPIVSAHADDVQGIAP